VLGVVAADTDPTGTIGFGGVEVLVESEPDDEVGGRDFWPFGITMGVALVSPPLLPPVIAAGVRLQLRWPVHGRRRPAFGVV
jgi:hypothetical protein